MKFHHTLLTITLVLAVGATVYFIAEYRPVISPNEYFEDLSHEEEEMVVEEDVREGWVRVSGDSYSVEYPSDWTFSLIGNGFQLFAPDGRELGEMVSKVEVFVSDAEGETIESFIEEDWYVQMQTFGEYEWATGETVGPLSIGDAVFGTIQNDVRVSVVAYSLSDLESTVLEIIGSIEVE
jgi:hypothetical protein